MKDLGQRNSNQKAIAVLNRRDTAVDTTIRWSDLGFSGSVEVRDVWKHINLEVGEVYTVTVPAHGTEVYKVTRDIGI